MPDHSQESAKAKLVKSETQIAEGAIVEQDPETIKQTKEAIEFKTLLASLMYTAGRNFAATAASLEHSQTQTPSDAGPDAEPTDEG